MKKLLVLAFVGLLVAGCENSKDVGLVGPDNSVQATSNSLTVLQLPASIEPRVLHKKNPFLVTPKDGGDIHYQDEYMSANGKVKIDLHLKFEKGAVNDSMVVDVNIDETDLAGSLNLDFGPSPTQFNIPAELDFSVQGLDPNSLPSDTSKVELVYDDNGNFIPMDAKEIKVNEKEGKLECKEGKIPHFSRYAWATKE